LNIRQDTYALTVLKQFKNKQDDLCDTICQIEAFCIYIGIEHPNDNSTTTTTNNNNSISSNNTNNSNNLKLLII
jgi:hypothetical protein